MILRVFDDKISLAKAAADQAATALIGAISARGTARVIAASAAPQVEFLEALTAMPGIDWQRVELFHLEEYIELPLTHPASFCKFLQERLIGTTGITNYHLLNCEENPKEVIREGASC